MTDIQQKQAVLLQSHLFFSSFSLYCCSSNRFFLSFIITHSKKLPLDPIFDFSTKINTQKRTRDKFMMHSPRKRKYHLMQLSTHFHRIKQNFVNKNIVVVLSDQDKSGAKKHEIR